MSNISDVKIVTNLLLITVEKYGLDRGGQILEAILPVVEVMKAWPEDIRDDALETFLTLFASIKKMASEPSSQ
jgi:hypothetical protein